MLPISTPSAPAIYKIIAGIPLLLIALSASYWSLKNLHLTVGMLQGRVPIPLGSSFPFVILGVGFYLVMLAVGLGALWFFLGLETAQPVIVSQEGIAWVDGPPLYRHELIPWREVTKVTCTTPPREIRIRTITIYSHDVRVELGNAGMNLADVLAIIKTRTPRNTVRPCEHLALDHSWSY